MTLTGLFVPLVTPFTASGELAPAALESLAHTVLDQGATGLVALGTTAETATLSPAEQRQVIDICTTVCTQHAAPLIIATGTNATTTSLTAITTLLPQTPPPTTAATLPHTPSPSTASALPNTPSPIVAVLVVVPYYTRPSEDGVVEHFRQVAAASPVPVIVYNVPYRTGRTLSADTLLRLAHLPNVAGFKHAVGGIDEDTIAFLSDVPAGTSVLAGDDLYAGPLVALGARGAITASANVAPRAYADLLTAWSTGQRTEARRLHNRLIPLAQALFAEPNPTVIKAVLAASGQIPSPYVRLPLLSASRATTVHATSAAAALLTPETATVSRG